MERRKCPLNTPLEYSVWFVGVVCCLFRFYWDRDIDDCIAKQTNTQFQYGYEYLGNSGRLVITPLTDRLALLLGGLVVRALDSGPRGREFDSRRLRFRVTRSTQPSIPPGR